MEVSWTVNVSNCFARVALHSDALGPRLPVVCGGRYTLNSLTFSAGEVATSVASAVAGAEVSGEVDMFKEVCRSS